MILADNLRQMLTELNMSQVEFADIIGLTPRYVTMLLSGKRNKISLSVANLIEERFEYSSEWLECGAGNKLLAPMKTDKERCKKIKRHVERLNHIDILMVNQYLDKLVYSTEPEQGEGSPLDELDNQEKRNRNLKKQELMSA